MNNINRLFKFSINHHRLDFEETRYEHIIKGNLLHDIMAKIITKEELFSLDFLRRLTLSIFSVNRISIDRWNIEEEFVNPIYKLKDFDFIDFIFPKYRKIYIEREFIYSHKKTFKVYRPDRIVFSDNLNRIIEFKSYYPFNNNTFIGNKKIIYKYHRQIENYIKICKNFFNEYFVGYILYIKDGICEFVIEKEKEIFQWERL